MALINRKQNHCTHVHCINDIPLQEPYEFCGLHLQCISEFSHSAPEYPLIKEQNIIAYNLYISKNLSIPTVIFDFFTSLWPIHRAFRKYIVLESLGTQCEFLSNKGNDIL